MATLRNQTICDSSLKSSIRKLFYRKTVFFCQFLLWKAENSRLLLFTMSGMERKQGLTQFFGMEEFLDVILEVETSGQGSFRFGCHKVKIFTKAMRSGNSFELWYIFVKMYRENRYILTGTFRYIFGIGIGTGNRLVSVVRKFSENLTENTSHFRSRFTM